MYAPSSIGGEDRPRGYNGLSDENSEVANARNTEKQQNCDRVAQCQSGLRTIENADETNEAPKEGKAYGYSP